MVFFYIDESDLNKIRITVDTNKKRVLEKSFLKEHLHHFVIGLGASLSAGSIFLIITG